MLSIAVCFHFASCRDRNDIDTAEGANSSSNPKTVQPPRSEATHNDLTASAWKLIEKLLAALEDAKDLPSAIDVVKAIEPEFASLAERMNEMGIPKEPEIKQFTNISQLCEEKMFAVMSKLFSQQTKPAELAKLADALENTIPLIDKTWPHLLFVNNYKTRLNSTITNICLFQ